VLLTGGSAFGLAAAHGVVDWCERAGIGYDRFGSPIPIVPAAVLFDLAVGDWNARPGPAEGEAACAAASTADGPMGNVGAGMGATVGKIAGPEHMMKGGLGYAVRALGQVTVGAIAAVNAGGDIIDEDGTVLAGARVPGGGRAALRQRLAEPETAEEGTLPEPVPPGGSTTLGAVVTNARLGKSEVYRVAVQAHDGMARAILPVHTTYDGDTVFAISVPQVGASMDLVAVLAEEALAEAIRAGVRAAATVAGIPGLGDASGPGAPPP
jgi:L-aminopeptidase/D-esterase-like protein